MTDSYVEDILIDKFLDLFSINEEKLVKQYFVTHKGDLEAYGKDEEEFYEWYKTYVSLPLTERNDEDDSLIRTIQKETLTPEAKRDENGDFIYSNFPNVAFPNYPFEKPKDEDGLNFAWYELFFITNEPMQIELGEEARSRWVGIFQVNICVPKTWGRREINARYNELATLFRSGININGVRVEKTFRTSALDDDDFYCLPVTISWWADLDR